jgi:ADP-ribosylglycohydrolase
VAGAYVDWLMSSPFDVGTTIRHALSAMRTVRLNGGSSPAEAGKAAASRSSQANGALMRQSPLAIWGWQLEADDLAAVAAADTALTHPNQVCLDASEAFVGAVAAAVRGGLSGRAIYEKACAWNRQHGKSPSVTAALEAAASRPPSFETNEGHVLIALQNAFYQAIHAPSFEEGLVDTVRGGGDTDSNAAVTGALLGAVHGYVAIPESWRTPVLDCRPAREAPGVRHPRPEVYWPGQTLRLAEQLANEGAAGRARLRAASAVEEGLPTGSAPARNVTMPIDQGPSRLMGHAMRRGRFRAALLGGAIGDALGRSAKRNARPQYAPPWPIAEYAPWRGYTSGPSGTVTDETQLTMLVAESLLGAGRLDPEDLARLLVDWLPIGRGKRTATETAMLRLREGVPWYLAGDESAGSGAAVRAAPIGLFRYHNLGLLRTEAMLASLPTHRLPLAVAGAVAMAAATGWLVTQAPGHWTARGFVQAVQAAIAGIEPAHASGATRATLYERIGELPVLLGQPASQALPSLCCEQPVLESVPSAFYCFLTNAGSAEAAILLAANGASSNADTLAAMTGTLSGALAGEEGLPWRLLGELECRDRLIDLADRLHERAVR